jgi:mannose-6-phosphate isomerase
LHKKESLASVDFDRGPVNPIVPREELIEGGVRETLARCRYFAMDRLRLRGLVKVGSPDRFTILLGLGGSADLRHGGQSFSLGLGQTRLLPAACGAVELAPTSAEAVVLTCIIPDAT